MSILAKRSKLLFALLPIMAVIFYTLTYTPELKASVTFKPVEKVDNIVALKEVPASGTPSDYSPIDNVAFANWILTHASYFQGTSNGEVMAKVGFINYNQTVYGLRKRSGEALFTQSISTSSMKNIAEQQYISGDTYLYRPGAKVKGNSAEFGDVYLSSGDAYLLKYGMPPFELCKYVLTEETVLSASVDAFPSTPGGGDYTFTFAVDAAKATEYYQNEVRTLSGSSSEYPQFESVRLTVTIGPDWTPKSFTVSEVYMIDKPVKAKCSASLTEVFSYIGDPQEVPEAEPFLSFVPSGDPDDNPYVPPTDPTDFLAAAFADYIQGKPLNLSAEISVPKLKLELNAKINIDLENKYGDVLLDDALYIGYRGDRVYLAAGNLRCYLGTREFVDMLPEILEEVKLLSPKVAGLLDSVLPKEGETDESEDESFLDSLMANAKIEQTDTETAVVLPISLGGILVDARIAMTPEPHQLTYISADVVKGATKLADVRVVPCDSIPFPALDDAEAPFADFSEVADFVLPALHTANAAAYSFTVDAAVQLPQLPVPLTLSGALTLNRDLTAQGTLTLDDLGLTLGVKHCNQTVYLSALGANLQMTDAQLTELLPTDLLQNVDLSTFDLAALLSYIQSVTVENKTLTATVKVNELPITVAVKHDGTQLTSLSVSIPETDGLTVAATLSLTALEKPVAVTAPEQAIDALALLDKVLPTVKQIMAAEQTSLNVCGQALGLDLAGTVRLSVNPLRVVADLTVADIPVSLALLSEGETFNLDAVKSAPVYIAIADTVKVQTTVNAIKPTLQRLLPKFGVTMPTLELSLPTLDNLALTENGLTVDVVMGKLQIAVELDGNKLTLTEIPAQKSEEPTEPTEQEPAEEPTEPVEPQEPAKPKFEIAATLGFADTFAMPDTKGYDKLADVENLLTAALSAADRTAFTLQGTAEVDFDSIQDTLAFTLVFDNTAKALDKNAKPKVKADFTLENMGIGGTVTYIDDTVYLSVASFRIKIPVVQKAATQKQSVQLPKLITDLLPQTVTKLIAGQPFEVSDLSVLLSYLTTLSVGEDSATVQLDTDKLGVALEVGFTETLQSAAATVTVARTDKKPVVLQLNATLHQDGAVTVPQGDFADPTQDLFSILEGQMLTAKIDMTVVTEGREITVRDADLALAVRNGEPELKLRATAFEVDVEVNLFDGKLYLAVGSLKLVLDRKGDRDAFLKFVEDNLPPFIYPLVQKFIDLDVDSLLDRNADGKGIDIDKLLGGIDLSDGISVEIPAAKATTTIRAKLPVPQNGVLANVGLDVHVNDTHVDLTVKAPTLQARPDTLNLNPQYPKAYVDLMDFAAFLPAIAGTVKAKGFELTLPEDLTVNFTGKVYAKDADGNAVKETITDKDGKKKTSYKKVEGTCGLTVEQDGVLRIVPLGNLGDRNFFVNVYAELKLHYSEEAVNGAGKVESRACIAELKATLVQETGGKFLYIDILTYPEGGDKPANGTKIKISYEELMTILGYAKKILNLQGTVLDDLTADYYEDIDTTIFDTMKIQGLDSLKNQLVDILGKVENVVDLLAGDEQYPSILQSVESLLKAPSLSAAKTDIANITGLMKVCGFDKEQSDADVFDTVTNAIKTVASLQLEFDTTQGLLTVHIPNPAQVDKDGNVTVPEKDDTVITLAHDSTSLTRLGIAKLDTSALRLDGGIALKVTGGVYDKEAVDEDGKPIPYTVTVTPPADAETFSDAPQKAEEYRTKYNDLGSVATLFKDLINTANLKKFHIGGNGTDYGSIQVKVLGYTITIPFVVKVDFIGNDPVVFVELNLQKVGLIGGAVVDKVLSRLFFYQDKFLLSRTYPISGATELDLKRHTKTEYVTATTEQLLKKNEETGELDVNNLLKYVYFLVPLGSLVRSPIDEAVAGSGDGQVFMNPSQVLNYYTYVDGSYKLGLDVGELAKNDSLGNLDLTLSTKKDEKGTALLDSIHAAINLVSVVDISIDGVLVNPGADVGNASYADWVEPNDQHWTGKWGITHYYRYADSEKSCTMTEIPAIMARIGNFAASSDYAAGSYDGTIDHPFSRSQVR